ncbi:MAG: sugar-binding domain-containing protein, partial [Anaerolineae bacterium]|nr:sugar-binding domain-containing protein [Anaerolineae bacterium]
MLYPIQNEKRNLLDLSGVWDFQTDPQETGADNGWMNSLPKPRPMAVPGSWNEQYEDLFNTFGLSWYVKKTYLPQSWKGECIFLRVGSACYFGTVYVNGKKVGSHEGGHLPFAFEINEFIKFDAENTIAISVENHLLPTRVPSGNISGGMEAASIMNGYPSTTYDFFPFAGLHRPVVLYTIPKIFIEDVTVETGFNAGTGWIKAQVKTNGAKGKGKVVVKDDTQTIEANLGFKNGAAEVTLQVPNVHLWSNSDPHLYDLHIITKDDHYSLK